MSFICRCDVSYAKKRVIVGTLMLHSLSVIAARVIFPFRPFRVADETAGRERRR